MMLDEVSRDWPYTSLGSADGALRARTRLSFAASDEGDEWQKRISRLSHAALVTDFDDIKHSGLPSMRIWVPYRALAETLELIVKMDLKATVCGSEFDPRALASPADSLCKVLDPRVTLSYALEVTNKDSAISHQPPVKSMPPCCALAHESTDRLLQNGGSGPLHAYVALASLGLTPLRYVPCSFACAATVENIDVFISRAVSLGFDDEAQAWRALQITQPSTTLRAGLMEVKISGLRLAYFSSVPERSNRIPVTLDNPLKSPSKTAAFVHKDPSFNSEFARRSRFSTILWEQERVINRSRGPIAHLGCGDGFLLELIKTVKPNAMLFGLQSNIPLEEFAVSGRFIGSHAGQAEEWKMELEAFTASREKLGLLLFDPIQLFALTTFERKMVVAAMHASAGAVVAYASDASLKFWGDIASLAKAAGITVLAGKQYRVSAVLTSS